MLVDRTYMVDVTLEPRETFDFSPSLQPRVQSKGVFLGYNGGLLYCAGIYDRVNSDIARDCRFFHTKS